MKTLPIFLLEQVIDGESPNDSIGLKIDNFMSVERGDIIRLRGYVTEFPTNQMTSATQFTPYRDCQFLQYWDHP